MKITPACEKRTDFRGSITILQQGILDGFNHNERERNHAADENTSAVILASAAVPTLFRAVRQGGHLYWDGLFAHYPPVRDLPDAARGEGVDGCAPNELWVIMINPMRQQREPKRMDDIRDRRNELAANISFQQEIYFIGKMNELAAWDLLADQVKKKYPLSRSGLSLCPMKWPQAWTMNPS